MDDHAWSCFPQPFWCKNKLELKKKKCVLEQSLGLILHITTF